MNFQILEKGVTNRGANYFKLLVEVEKGVWLEATYFGNTTPKEVTKISTTKNGSLVVEIQKHTSRDKYTGKFKKFTRK